MHDEYINLNDPDIVQVLTFCAYSGTISGKSRGDYSKMVFTGPAVENRLIPLMRKLGKSISHFKSSRIAFRKKTVEEKWTAYWPKLIESATEAGWKFKKAISEKIPEYVFKNPDLFLAFWTTLIDCRASIALDSENAGQKIRAQIAFSRPEDAEYLVNQIKTYNKNCPIPFLHGGVDKHAKSGRRMSMVWYTNAAFNLLDFIGWNLYRPSHLGIMKYMRENREAKELGKDLFI